MVIPLAWEEADIFPSGSVSAGMWSTVCTRVALLVTAQIKDWIQAATSKQGPKSKASKADEEPREKSEKESIPVAGETKNPSAARRRATAAAAAGGKEEL